jgi:hypothetical protein
LGTRRSKSQPRLTPEENFCEFQKFDVTRTENGMVEAVRQCEEPLLQVAFNLSYKVCLVSARAAYRIKFIEFNCYRHKLG